MKCLSHEFTLKNDECIIDVKVHYGGLIRGIVCSDKNEENCVKI